jgi:HPt (histidine-containing phosphotransfer) domain-containing protein
VEKQDAAQIERTAHSFRGCLASFNAKPAVDISGQLEIMSRQQTMTDPSRLIDQLVVEIEALVPHLERIAKQISG